MKGPNQFALDSKKKITVAVVIALTIVSTSAVLGVRYINSRQNVNPDSSLAANVTNWTKIGELKYGMHAKLTVADTILYGTGSETSSAFVNKASAMHVINESSVGPAMNLGNHGDLRGNVVPWDGSLAMGQYPYSGVYTFDKNGTYLPNKSNTVAWGQSVWSTGQLGDTFKSPQDNQRLYYARNIINSSIKAEYSQLSFIKNWSGSGKTGVSGYHVTRLNIKRSPSAWGPMKTVGSYLYAAENIFKKGGKLIRLGPLPADWQGSEKLLPEQQIAGLPNATITALLASNADDKLYVAAFDQSSGNANYKGMVYTVDIATGKLQGAVRYFPVPSHPSSLTLQNGKLYIGFGNFNDNPGRNTGIASCKIGANNTLDTCDPISRPEEVYTVTDVQAYKNSVYAVGLTRYGTGAVYKLKP